jgi:hypothetical protein
MKPIGFGVLLVWIALLSTNQPTFRAETGTIDLKALAEKVRPAVLLKLKGIDRPFLPLGSQLPACRVEKQP